MNEAVFLLILMLAVLLISFLVAGAAFFLLRSIRARLRDSELPKGDF